MPIYEYKCGSCKGVFEVFSTSCCDSPVVKCAKCGSIQVRKTISAASFRINSGSASTPAGALSGCSSKSRFS